MKVTFGNCCRRGRVFGEVRVPRDLGRCQGRGVWSQGWTADFEGSAQIVMAEALTGQDWDTWGIRSGIRDVLEVGRSVRLRDLECQWQSAIAGTCGD